MNRDERRVRASMLSGFERRSATGLEVREVGASTLSIGGWASVVERAYDMGYYQETIKRGAFAKTLSEKPDVQLLMNHEGLPLARTLSGTLRLSEDSTGLRFDADLNANDPDVQRLAPKVQRGDISECSFAFRTTSQVWNDDYDERSITSVGTAGAGALRLEETELVAVDIGERDRTGAGVADVEAGGAERQDVIEPGRRVGAWLRSDVEVEPLLAGPRHQRRPAPGDLWTGAVGCLDRSFLVLIPDQRPSEHLAPEAPERVRPIAVNRPEAGTAGEEAVVWIDDAELVALGVGENDMGVAGVLTDVDVPRTDREELGHRVVLVIERRRREIEVDPVLADLLGCDRPEEHVEAGGVRRQELDADSTCFPDVPAQCVRPELRELVRCHGVERDRNELRRHRSLRKVIIVVVVILIEDLRATTLV